MVVRVAAQRAVDEVRRHERRTEHAAPVRAAAEVAAAHLVRVRVRVGVRVRVRLRDRVRVGVGEG